MYTLEALGKLASWYELSQRSGRINQSTQTPRIQMPQNEATLTAAVKGGAPAAKLTSQSRLLTCTSHSQARTHTLSIYLSLSHSPTLWQSATLLMAHLTLTFCAAAESALSQLVLAVALALALGPGRQALLAIHFNSLSLSASLLLSLSLSNYRHFLQFPFARCQL